MIPMHNKVDPSNFDFFGSPARTQNNDLGQAALSFNQYCALQQK